TFGSQVGAMHIMSIIAERIQHPDTLRWYLYAHIPYESTFSVMKVIIKKLESNTLSHEQTRYNHIFLRLAADRLTRYVEDIGAYMMYKGRVMDEQQPEMMNFAVTDLITTHNMWLAKIYEQINDQKPDYSILSRLIDS